METFTQLEKQLEYATFCLLKKSFVVECGTSNVAISGVLNQDGRPVMYRKYRVMSYITQR